MPLPRVTDGKKLSLLLPVEVVRRVKHEAIDRGVIPAEVVRLALAAWWGESPATTQKQGTTRQRSTPRQREVVSSVDMDRRRSLFTFVDTLVTAGRFTQVDIMGHIGTSPANYRSGWRAAGAIPEKHVEAVITFLRSQGVTPLEIAKVMKTETPLD